MDNKWINVNVRLPQIYFSVLFCDIDNNVGEAHYSDDGSWYSIGDWKELYHVTYWMPLPLPPINQQ